MKIDIEEVEMALDMHYKTEIIATTPMNHAPGDDLMRVRARGAVAAIQRQQYVRPMFEVIPTGLKPFQVQQVPCADCGDFSRSWNCEAHTYWSPVGDEDDLTVMPERDTAFSEGPIMRDIRRMIVDAYRVPPALMPDSFLRGLQDISIDFTITEEGMAALNEALVSGPRRRVESSLHSIIEQFGLDDED